MGLGNVAPAPVMVAVAEGAFPPVPAEADGARSPEEQASPAATMAAGHRNEVRSTRPSRTGGWGQGSARALCETARRHLSDGSACKRRVIQQPVILSEAKEPCVGPWLLRFAQDDWSLDDSSLDDSLLADSLLADSSLPG